MNGRYILRDRKPVECADLLEWGRWFEDIENRRVARDEFGDVHVSTVFLGLDHRFGDEGPLILFETMIFGGEHDGYERRYSTWTEAEAGHAKAVRMARPYTKAQP